MKRVCAGLLLTGLAIGLVLASGCSSDDDEANPIISGDPNSPSFEVYDNTIADVPGSIAQIGLSVTLDLMDWRSGSKRERGSIPGGHARTGVSLDSIAWSYANGWNVFYFEMSELTSEPAPGGGMFEDSMWITGWDSLRFFEDGTVMPAPSDTTDSLYSRQHVSLIKRNSRGESWDVAGHHRISLYDGGFAFGYGPLIEVDMTGLDSVTALLVDPDDHVCDLNLITGVTLDDIVMPLTLIDEVCPSFGSFQATQSVALSCGGGTSTDSVAFDGVWQVTELFVNGVAHQTLTFGNTVWTHIDSCGAPLSEME